MVDVLPIQKRVKEIIAKHGLPMPKLTPSGDWFIEVSPELMLTHYALVFIEGQRDQLKEQLEDLNKSSRGKLVFDAQENKNV